MANANEIKISVELVDKVTSKAKKIKKSLKDALKDVPKQTKDNTKGFNKMELALTSFNKSANSQSKRSVASFNALNRTIFKMNDSMRALANRTEKLGNESKKARHKVDGLKNSLDKTKSSGIGLTGILGGAGLGLAIGYLAKKIITAKSSFENLEVQFQTILGSTELATERMKELADFASSTPFQLEGVAKASKLLETLTQGTLSTGEGLRMVGDASAIAGVPIEELASHIGRANDLLKSGRSAGDSLARLQDLGLIAGKTRTKIEDLQKQAKGVEAWNVLQKELEKTKGGMEKLSNTMSGKFSTLKDKLDEFYRALFNEGAFQSAKNGLTSLISLTESFTKSINDFNSIYGGGTEGGYVGELKHQIALNDKLIEQNEQRKGSGWQGRNAELKDDNKSLLEGIELEEIMKKHQDDNKGFAKAHKEKAAKKEEDKGKGGSADAQKEEAKIAQEVREEMANHFTWIDAYEEEQHDKTLERVRRRGALQRVLIDQERALEMEEGEAKLTRLQELQDRKDEILKVSDEQKEERRKKERKRWEEDSAKQWEDLKKDQGKEEKLKKRNKELDELSTKATISNINNIGQSSKHGLTLMKKIFGETKEIRIASATVEGGLAVTQAFTSAPYPYNFVNAGLVTAQVGMNINKMSKAEKGADFQTSGPEWLLVGDNAGGKEQVSVKPVNTPNLNGSDSEGGGGGVVLNVNIGGNADESTIDALSNKALEIARAVEDVIRNRGLRLTTLSGEEVISV